MTDIDIMNDLQCCSSLGRKSTRFIFRLYMLRCHPQLRVQGVGLDLYLSWIDGSGGSDPSMIQRACVLFMLLRQLVITCYKSDTVAITPLLLSHEKENRIQLHIRIDEGIGGSSPTLVELQYKLNIITYKINIVCFIHENLSGLPY